MAVSSRVAMSSGVPSSSARAGTEWSVDGVLEALRDLYPLDELNSVLDEELA